MNKLVAQTLAKKENGEKGFTLIELLVVVIIIGILAAIAIPIFLNMRTGAWKSSVETDVANAVLVVEQASAANNGVVKGLTVTAQTGPGLGYTVGGISGTASEGNTITITPSTTANTYTVTGTNANLSGAEALYSYDSTSGRGDWIAKPAG